MTSQRSAAPVLPVALVLALGCSSAPEPNAAEAAYESCSHTQADKRVALRDAVEARADVLVRVVPLSDEVAKERFGAAPAYPDALWEVTIDVKKLPESTKLVARPSSYTRDCKQLSFTWGQLWPSALDGLYPEPAEPGAATPLPPIPPTYQAIPAPEKIPKGENPLWAILDEATGKQHPTKKAYKLTPADKTAWDTFEEDKRQRAKEAHDAAAAEVKRLKEERAAVEATFTETRDKIGRARTALSNAAVPKCKPAAFVMADALAFVAPARCTYVSTPNVKQLPPAKACGIDAGDRLDIAVEWVLEGESEPCSIDGAATRTFAKSASALEALDTLFKGGEKSLRDLRKR